ncbi:Dihydropyrimidine dehydrogenase [NADP(+)] [Orobanche gracilis]
MASLKLTSQINTPAAEFPAARPCRMQSFGGFSKNRAGFRIFAQPDADPDLSVTVNGLKMPNPFVIGSGPPGTNHKVMKRAFDDGWGAVIAKTVAFLLH